MHCLPQSLRNQIELSALRRGSDCPHVVVRKVNHASAAHLGVVTLNQHMELCYHSDELRRYAVVVGTVIQQGFMFPALDERQTENQTAFRTVVIPWQF